MKKFMLSITLLLAAVLLLACNTEPDPEEGETVKMTATITAIGEKIEVNVIESEYTDGIYLVITSDETVFLDKEGNEIERSDLAIDSTVEILYSGQVMMSYPPQIVARKITVL